jgi:amino acid transporter
MLLIKPFAAAAIGLTFAKHFDGLLGVSCSPHAVACAMVVLLTALNAVTLKGSSATAIVLTSLKVLALVAIVGLGAGLGKGSAANFSSVPSQPIWRAFAPVMYGILWTYDGWADVSAISGEVVDPRRQLPRILLAGTAATIALYVAVNAVYFSMVPIAEMRDLDTVAPLVMERLLGKAGSGLVTAVIVISTLGATHGAILTGARVTFAQARDGLLFRFLGRIDPAHQTPAVSLWVQAVTACAAVLYLRQFKDLSEGYGFMMWIFHALVAAAVIVLRTKRPDLERPYKCWGYPWVPLVFIGMSLGMTVLYMARTPRTTIPWLGVLLLGLPTYWIWKSLSKDAVVSGDLDNRMSKP